MKKLNGKYLPWVVLGAGLLGAAVRYAMFRFCLDGRELLTPGNLPLILVYLLTAALAALVFLSARHLTGSDRYEDNFGPSPLAGIGALAGIAGIALLLFRAEAFRPDRLYLLWRYGGFAAMACLAVTGLCRFRGKQPKFLFHTLLSVFFSLHLAHHYRLWSGVPQTELWVWQLWASVGLIMNSHFLACFDANMGKRPQLMISSLLGGYACLLAAPDQGGISYLLLGIWAIFSGCRPVPVPPLQEEKEETSE